MDASDPRLDWLLSQAPRWRDAGEKTLVFVAHRETLEMLRTALSHRAQLATRRLPRGAVAGAARHRGGPVPRAEGPSLLVSTECGGEGRNFEFCRRLVLFDLPWKPSVVEQRIGRLDRIGRRIPVEIVYFRPPGGIGADVVRLFEALGLFREPLAGLEPQLAHVEGALEEIALDPLASLVGRTVRRPGRRGARGAHAHPRGGVPAAASRPVPRRRWPPASSRACPPELDALNEEVVVAACDAPRLHASSARAAAARSRSSSATRRSSTACRASRRVDATSARSIARRRSRTRRIDFFASGHPLVEGMLRALRGQRRSAASRGFEVEIGERTGRGAGGHLQGRAEFEVVAIDSDGGIARTGRRHSISGRFAQPLFPPTRTMASTGRTWSAAWVRSSTRLAGPTRSRPSSYQTGLGVLTIHLHSQG